MSFVDRRKPALFCEQLPSAQESRVYGIFDARIAIDRMAIQENVRVETLLEIVTPILRSLLRVDDIVLPQIGARFGIVLLGHLHSDKLRGIASRLEGLNISHKGHTFYLCALAAFRNVEDGRFEAALTGIEEDLIERGHERLAQRRPHLVFRR